MLKIVMTLKLFDIVEMLIKVLKYCADIVVLFFMLHLYVQHLLLVSFKLWHSELMVDRPVSLFSQCIHNHSIRKISNPLPSPPPKQVLSKFRASVMGILNCVTKLISLSVSFINKWYTDSCLTMQLFILLLIICLQVIHLHHKKLLKRYMLS